MPKYDLREPLEGLGLGNAPFKDFDDLHIHHPGTNRDAVRNGNAAAVDSDAGVVNGELEAVRRENGNVLIKKDIVFLDQNGSGNVQIPAPIQGYVHYLNPNTYGSVRIYDKPFGTPGAELLGQVLHLDRNSLSLKEGEFVQYGQPIGIQAGTGPNGRNHFGTHAHVELELEQFKKYVADLKSGVITQETYPVRGSTQAASALNVPVSALADGVLREGERGADVTALQEQLIRLKFKDAQGRELTPDGDFGGRTKEAVKAFQSAHHLTDDGIVGKDTFAALRQAVPGIQVSAPAVTPVVPAAITAAAGTTALSNLIGSGEGGYNSYNRGVAGDSRTPINLSDMTVSEIMRRQDLPRNDPDRLFAVGKFQIIPGTMEATVRNLGLNGSEKFTPALQERMFADYLIDEKRPSVKAYITGQSGPDGLGRAQLALAQEFASVANPQTGRSYYDGDSGGNHSSISARQVETALNQMRTQYQTNVASGLSPDAAYRALNGQGQVQAPATSAPAHASTAAGALADGVLRQGERGPDVKKLQEQLNALHIKDKDGNALVPDGNFGKHTKEAVKAFQSAHHLTDDGIVGKDTFAALKKAEAPVVTSQPATSARTDQTPLLSNPAHPDNKLYQQALAGMEKLPAGTFKSEQERQNVAAAVTFEAKVSGMSKIDTVALSTNGSGLFAVQGAMNDPGHHRIYVDKTKAAAQSIEKSTQQLQQENMPVAAQAQAQESQRKAATM